MGTGYDFSRNAVLASTVLIGTMGLSTRAGAIAYTDVSALNLGGAAGLTVYVDHDNSYGTGQIAVGSGTVTIGGNVGFDAGSDTNSGLTGSGTINISGALDKSATTVITASKVVATGGTVSNATFGTADTAIQNVYTKVAALTPTVTVAGGTASAVGSVRSGYNAITVSSQLTNVLTLNFRTPDLGNVADYFFIYLSGGMSNTGSIVTTGSSIDASHIIIASNGNATVTGSTQMGNYIMQKGTLTIGSSATLTGGVFMSTNTSTNSDELLMNSGAKIVSGAWNGIVSASAPEPLR